MENTKKYTLHVPSFYTPVPSRHPLYGQWAMMISRCRNPNLKAWDRYGGRGIKVCDRWINGENGMTGFECFFEDMGNKPSKKHSLDRIDNDGDYSPSNCQWVNDTEQANNRSNNRNLTYKGETMSMMKMAKKHGVSYFVLRNRVSRGWPTDLAIELPHGASWKPKDTATGDRLPQTVLNEELVREIREIYARGGITMNQLSLKYNISAASVCLLVNRKTWAHVK